MILKVTDVRHIKDHLLEVKFSDGCIKRFDFDKLNSYEGEMALPLKDVSFFSKVSIVANGGGIGWPNDYDCCVDWLRYFALDETGEWKKYDDSFSLDERIKLTEKKITA